MKLEKSGFKDILEELFRSKPHALAFMREFLEFCHKIDDYVDGDVAKTDENFLAILANSCRLYSCNYFAANSHLLYPLIINITNSYADSLIYENSKEKWKRQFGDVLRSSGNEMILGIINLEYGYEKAREFSLLIREDSYYQHHDIKGNPV